MKAYIFKPSERWRYCGGGLIILANSFDEAQSLYIKYNNDDDSDNNDKLWKNEKEAGSAEKDWFNWTLVTTLDCPNENTAKVLFVNYNFS